MSEAVIENSYMLPHGARAAHNPRRMTATSSEANASQVSDIPTFAARFPRSLSSPRRRPTDHENAKANMATVSAAIAP